ncbi:MAG: DUF4214 domain-containing protein [Burkholderiales bacterium]|nr:DUF4214 domain-containing protein [Burkholderiales bacterium]
METDIRTRMRGLGEGCRPPSLPSRVLAAAGRFATLILLAATLAGPGAARAEARMTLAFDTPGSLIIPDSVAGVMRRSDGGTPLPIRFNAPGQTTSSAFLYFIPTEATTVDGVERGDFALRFRVDDIPLECQGGSDWKTGDIWVNGPSPEYNPVITGFRKGTGVGDFVEFVYNIPGYPLSWLLGASNYFDLQFGSLEFPCNWWSRITFTFVSPVAIFGGAPPDATPAPFDRHFRLVKRAWPDSFVDNGLLPEYISLDSQPLGGETVDISGTNVIYRPSSATTDANGYFGVLAFVDPAEFDKSASAKSSGSMTGNLTVKYKQIMSTQGISGNFAEVIQAEGRITIVDGTGTVKVGDILRPGTKLSLSARIGEPPAQLGLRFINGADAQLVQDVFTNACLTDIIVIGQTEISNKSVIQGKTPLMSVTRWLCEQAGGLPNTPEEWALATGKFTVKLAVSSLVPVPMGYEAGAFVVKYAVGKVTGAVYDYTVSSPGDNRNKSTKAAFAPVKSTGLARLELGTYYDGSTRLAENVPGDFAVYAGAADTAFAISSDGVWQEFLGGAAVARTFAQTPDSIDKAGPLLRLSSSYSQPLWLSTFTLVASDSSGLDPATLSVTIDGLAGEQASAFEYRGEGRWVAEFLGAPPAGITMHIGLSDRVGNRSALDWLGNLMPAPPQTLTAYFYGGQTWLEWSPPGGMAPDDLLYYEVRQNYWNTLGQWVAGPWQSVGSVPRTTLDLPAGFAPANTFYVEVRAWNRLGMAGHVARTVDLTAVQTTQRLDVTRSGNGSGTVAGDSISCGDDCTAFYVPGSLVTLTASPGAWSTFTGWSGACSGTGSCQVTMDAARSVTATFTLKTLGLTVSTAGSGTVTSNPAGISCGATCTAAFDATSNVSLTAVALPGWVFAGWSGAGCEGTGACTVAMTASRAVSATFVAKAATKALTAYPASLDFGGQSMGTTSPARTVTVTNTGTGAVGVGSVASGEPQFTLSHDCASLAEGASCLVTVSFRPAVAAGVLLSTVPVAGALTVASDAVGAPHQVPLAGTAEKSLVSHYYRSILRREPDDGGKAYWSGEAARAQSLGLDVTEAWFALAATFYTSAEYQALGRDDAGFIADLYNTFFNRAPDAGGLAYWAGLVAGGLPREVALVGFMFSAEFRAFTQGIFGTIAARAEVDTVTDFYRGLFSRLPDDGGFVFWLARFRAAQCAGGAAVNAETESISSQYALSAEYAARARSDAQYVGDLYNAFLRRGGDLSGVLFWINQVASGSQTREQVRQAFVASPEFQARVAAVIGQGCLP